MRVSGGGSQAQIGPFLQRSRADLPCSLGCLHGVFLFFFVLFLIVGVALTCVGFLEYDPIEPDVGVNSGPYGEQPAMAVPYKNGSKRENTAHVYRVLGTIALLLCIGFLIAACVIVSECLTSALKYESVDVVTGEQQQYELLYANPPSNQDYISLQPSQSTYSYTTTSTGALCDRHSKLYTDSCQSQMTALNSMFVSKLNEELDECECDTPDGNVQSIEGATNNVRLFTADQRHNLDMMHLCQEDKQDAKDWV